MAFDISQKVKVANPVANIDYYYGLYESVDAACAAVPVGVRSPGKTVGIYDEVSAHITEYWWERGIEDYNLVPKVPAMRPTTNDNSLPVADDADRITAENTQEIINVLSSYGIDEATGLELLSKLQGLRIQLDKTTASNSYPEGVAGKLLVDYPIWFKVNSTGAYIEVLTIDGKLSTGLIAVATQIANGLMTAADKKKLDNIPEGGSNLSHSWSGTTLTVTSSSGTSTSVSLKGERGDVSIVDDYDFSGIRKMAGQPEILFGAGTPQEAIVPDNWIQFADGGYDWNGSPSKLGQRYINTAVDTGGLYVAVRNGEFLLKWQQIS